MKCPNCKVDIDLHGDSDFEDCLRTLAWKEKNRKRRERRRKAKKP